MTTADHHWCKPCKRKCIVRQMHNVDLVQAYHTILLRRIVFIPFKVVHTYLHAQFHIFIIDFESTLHSIAVHSKVLHTLTLTPHILMRVSKEPHCWIVRSELFSKNSWCFRNALHFLENRKSGEMLHRCNTHTTHPLLWRKRMFLANKKMCKENVLSFASHWNVRNVYSLPCFISS